MAERQHEFHRSEQTKNRVVKRRRRRCCFEGARIGGGGGGGGDRPPGGAGVGDGAPRAAARRPLRSAGHRLAAASRRSTNVPSRPADAIVDVLTAAAAAAAAAVVCSRRSLRRRRRLIAVGQHRTVAPIQCHVADQLIPGGNGIAIMEEDDRRLLQVVRDVQFQDATTIQIIVNQHVIPPPPPVPSCRSGPDLEPVVSVSVRPRRPAVGRRDRSGHRLPGLRSRRRRRRGTRRGRPQPRGPAVEGAGLERPLRPARRLDPAPPGPGTAGGPAGPPRRGLRPGRGPAARRAAAPPPGGGPGRRARRPAPGPVPPPESAPLLPVSHLPSLRGLPPVSVGR